MGGDDLRRRRRPLGRGAHAATGATAASRFDERLVEAQAACGEILLRMPEHGEAEAMVEQFGGFDEAVGGMSRGREAVGERSHTLMMV